MREHKQAPRWMLSNEQAALLKARFGWEVQRNGVEALASAVMMGHKEK